MLTEKKKELSTNILRESPSLSSMRDKITPIRTKKVGSIDVENNDFPESLRKTLQGDVFMQYYSGKNEKNVSVFSIKNND